MTIPFLQETRCFCSWILEDRQLNETCELMTSSIFYTDVIGTDAQGYFDFNYQIAMYDIYDGIIKIKGLKSIFVYISFYLVIIIYLMLSSICKLFIVLIVDNSDGCLMNTFTGFSSYPCDSIGTTYG